LVEIARGHKSEIILLTKTINKNLFVLKENRTVSVEEKKIF